MFLLLSNREFAISNSRIELIKLIKKEIDEEVSVYAYPDGYRPNGDSLYRLIESPKTNSLKGAFNYLKKLFRIIRKRKPSFVHAFNPIPIYSSGILRYLFSFKLVITITGLGRYYIREKEPIRIVLNLLYYLSFRKASRVIFQNSDDYHYFSGKFPSLKDRMKLIKSGGVSLGQFNYKEQEESDVFNVLNVSRLLKQKGIEEFYNVIKHYRDKSDIRFTLIGEYDKDHPDSIGEDLYNNLKKISNLTLLPFQDDLSEYYSRADLFLFCSKREGFPRVVLEANSFKVPTLAYKTVGVRDSVLNFETGLLISEGNTKSMIKAFELLYRNPSLLKIFGENARREVLSNYVEAKVYSRYIDEYKLLI